MFEPMMDPVALIADEMRSRGISQRALAHRSGIDHSTISRILAGQREPFWRTVIDLLTALGASVEIRGKSEANIQPRP